MGTGLALYHMLLSSTVKANVLSSLKLMGKGMLGVFIVMLLIYLVVVILNKTSGSKENKK
ncbi:MAG TPA: hypothetical protein DIV41_06895 [Ruminococcaceae bacterium]|nr:hypothetical protein [Oscillospiraceae bacterium]